MRIKTKLTDHQIINLIKLFGIKYSRSLISLIDKPMPDKKFFWYINESKNIDIKKLKILEVVSCSHYDGVKYLLGIFNNDEGGIVEYFKEKECGVYYFTGDKISVDEVLDPDIKLKIYEKNITIEGFEYAKSMIDEYDSQWKYIKILKGDD